MISKLKDVGKVDDLSTLQSQWGRFGALGGVLRIVKYNSRNANI